MKSSRLQRIEDAVQEHTGIRKQDVIVFTVSAIIGLSIIAVNVVYFNSIEIQHTVSYDDQPDLLTIDRQEPARTIFSLDNPESMGDGVGITITFEQITGDTTVTPTINGKTYEAVNGLQNGGSHTIHIEQDDLQEVNQIRLDGTFPSSNRATIAAITVRGVTDSQRIVFIVLNILGLGIMIGPGLILKYRQYSVRQVLEEQFPNFLRDVVEGTRAGMSLPQAIKNARNNNYADLNPYVDAMGAKLEWGLPFEKVMEDFGEQTSSPIIRRSVTAIVQTYRAGGNVSQVLETIGSNLKEIRRLRQERESQIYGEMVTGYIIYFVFLLVLVILVRYLLPALTFSGVANPLGGDTPSVSSGELIDSYRLIFQWLIIVQSIFSGLVIGRLSEGELKAGGKHVGILLIVGYSVAIFLL